MNLQVNIAVIRTHCSNELFLLSCSQLLIFSGLCVQTSVTICDPKGLHPDEAYGLSYIRVYSVLPIYII